MLIHLQYGKDGLEIDISSNNVTTLAPRFIPGLPDEAAAFRDAVRAPINSKPLRELIGPNDRVAVVIPDITRPLPSDRLLSWLFAELDRVPSEKFVIVNGTGSHRVNTPAELGSMVGDGFVTRLEIIKHELAPPATPAFGWKAPDGGNVFIKR